MRNRARVCVSMAHIRRTTENNRINPPEGESARPVRVRSHRFRFSDRRGGNYTVTENRRETATRTGFRWGRGKK